MLPRRGKNSCHKMRLFICRFVWSSITNHHTNNRMKTFPELQTQCANTAMHTSTEVHTHACKHACTHARTHARMHTRTHARMHTRTHARMHAHTHTHTLVHVCVCVCACNCIEQMRISHGRTQCEKSLLHNKSLVLWSCGARTRSAQW